MRLLFALLVLLVGSSEASSANVCAQNEYVKVGDGIWTGAKLNELSELDLRLYASAVADAWSTILIFGASEECFTKLRSCTVGRSNAQFGAMLKKYLRDNPAEWHLQGALIAYKAILMDCLHK
jgi:hypothetical protein